VIWDRTARRNWRNREKLALEAAAQNLNDLEPAIAPRIFQLNYHKAGLTPSVGRC